MGTRSLTIIKDEYGVTLINMYRQMDGYFSGMGANLAEFLREFTMVDGLGFGDKGKIANGMGCLAALLVSHFKGDTPGGIYLLPPTSRGAGEEYIYTVEFGGWGYPPTLTGRAKYSRTVRAGLDPDTWEKK